MRSTTRVVALLGLVLAGCSTHDPALLPPTAELRSLPLRVREHRIVVLPPAGPAPARAADEDARSGPMAFDPLRLQRELVDALREVVEAPADGEVTVVAARSAEEALTLWEEGYDVVVQARATRWDAAFLGTNGWWYPNAFFLSWYFFPVGPQWLLADERYGVACELDLTCSLAGSERPLPGLEDRRLTIATPLEAPTEAEAAAPAFRRAPPAFDLDDTQRGIDLFGTYTPGDLDPEQWEQVGTLLGPFAYRHAALQMAAALAQDVDRFDGLPPAERRARAATLHALTIGVTDYGAAARPCAGAADDARRLADALTGDLAPAKNVLVLQNQNAGAGGVREALARLAARARPDDAVVVTFAGRGLRGADGTSHALLLADGASLPLDELLSALNGIDAARRVLVLDADFDGGPRAAVDDLRPDAPALLEAITSRLGPADVVVLASDGEGLGQAQAYEDETGAMGGLLSLFVARALEGEADVGRDGLTTGDLVAYLDHRVPHVALTLPRPQRPRVLVTREEALAEPLLGR